VTVRELLSQLVDVPDLKSQVMVMTSDGVGLQAVRLVDCHDGAVEIVLTNSADDCEALLIRHRLEEDR